MSQVSLVTYNKDKKNENFEKGRYVAIWKWDIGCMSQIGLVT